MSKVAEVAVSKGFVVPAGALEEGLVVRNTEEGTELWVCGCGAHVSGTIEGAELRTAYTKMFWRLRKVGSQRVARCGTCSGALAEHTRKVAEKKAQRESAKAQNTPVAEPVKRARKVTPKAESK